MTAPGKGEQDLPIHLVQQWGWRNSDPLQANMRFSTHLCPREKQIYTVRRAPWPKNIYNHNTQQGEKREQDRAWREQAELWHKQPVRQLECCPTDALANLQDPSVKLQIWRKGR